MPTAHGNELVYIVINRGGEHLASRPLRHMLTLIINTSVLSSSLYGMHQIFLLSNVMVLVSICCDKLWISMGCLRSILYDSSSKMSLRNFLLHK